MEKLYGIHSCCAAHYLAPNEPWTSALKHDLLLDYLFIYTDMSDKDGFVLCLKTQTRDKNVGWLLRQIYHCFQYFSRWYCRNKIKINEQKAPQQDKWPCVPKLLSDCVALTPKPPHSTVYWNSFCIFNKTNFAIMSHRDEQHRDEANPTKVWKLNKSGNTVEKNVSIAEQCYAWIKLLGVKRHSGEMP